MDVINPKCACLPLFSAAVSFCVDSANNPHVRYNAGLPAGVSEINFEFTATSDTFSCSPEPCPGTYGMKLSVCELECEDSKHAGHAVLDTNDSLTFTIPNNS